MLQIKSLLEYRDVSAGIGTLFIWVVFVKQYFGRSRNKFFVELEELLVTTALLLICVFGTRIKGGLKTGRTVCCGKTGIIVPFASINVPGPSEEMEDTDFVGFAETTGFDTRPELLITEKNMSLSHFIFLI